MIYDPSLETGTDFLCKKCLYLFHGTYMVQWEWQKMTLQISDIWNETA